MKKILILAFCLFSIACHPSRTINKLVNSCLQLDIVLLVDVSGSVKGHELFIKEAISEFTNKFEGTDVRTAMVTFGDKIITRFHLGEPVNTEFYCIGGTPLAQGIERAVEELFNEYSRDGYKKLIIILSDEDPDSKSLAINNVLTAKNMNISICGVLINSISNDSSFLESLSDIYVETNYELLSKELQNLSLCL